MSDIFMGYINDEDAIEHHGIIGQKWGVRRYQNKDGSLTSEGKRRYSNSEVHRMKKEYKNEFYKK